jgi:hypothetical protein
MLVQMSSRTHSNAHSFTWLLLLLYYSMILLYYDNSFAIAGVALFNDVDTVGAEIDPRYSFATMRQAMLAMAFLTVTNNWNDLLYPVIGMNNIMHYHIRVYYLACRHKHVYCCKATFEAKCCCTLSHLRKVCNAVID